MSIQKANFVSSPVVRVFEIALPIFSEPMLVAWCLCSYRASKPFPSRRPKKMERWSDQIISTAGMIFTKKKELFKKKVTLVFPLGEFQAQVKLEWSLVMSPYKSPWRPARPRKNLECQNSAIGCKATSTPLGKCQNFVLLFASGGNLCLKRRSANAHFGLCASFCLLVRGNWSEMLQRLYVAILGIDVSFLKRKKKKNKFVALTSQGYAPLPSKNKRWWGAPHSLWALTKHRLRKNVMIPSVKSEWPIVLLLAHKKNFSAYHRRHDSRVFPNTPS